MHVDQSACSCTCLCFTLKWTCVGCGYIQWNRVWKKKKKVQHWHWVWQVIVKKQVHNVHCVAGFFSLNCGLVVVCNGTFFFFLRLTWLDKLSFTSLSFPFSAAMFCTAFNKNKRNPILNWARKCDPCSLLKWTVHKIWHVSTVLATILFV